MATGTKSDFTIYNEQFYAGQIEVLQRNVNAFNAASAGCIQLITDFHKGDFEKESFFEKGVHINHRDPTSTAALTPTKLTQGEESRVKVHKSYLIENTLDSFKKIARDPREMSYIVGQQMALDIMDQFLSSALSSLVGGFGVAGAASLVTTESTGAINSTKLNTAISKFGDAAGRIGILVMHSKVYFDLIGSQITDKLLEVTAGALYQGSPATFGRPVLVTDHPALWTAGSSTASSADDVYHTFGLRNGAVTIQESEERSVLAETVGGKANLIARIQAEWAYTVGMSGMSFTGSANPADSALATSGNWTVVAADVKSLMGVDLKTR